MKKIIITLLLFTVSIWMNAQVQGIVKTKEGEPIIGASVFWAQSMLGTTTDEKGLFSISKPSNQNQLVVSFVGYQNDTIMVSQDNCKIEVKMKGEIEMQEVEVVARKMGTLKMRSSVINQDLISTNELVRAACCNLGESFTTNPSVDVSYADAATGAKQIRLLGLSGSYVQMLTENIPNYRGAAAPFALGYVPGPWMQSIQVSKGSSSVKNGYEAITGQINIEFKKPQAPQSLHVNLYGDSNYKMEANFDGNIALNRRLSTALLAHYENSSASHDSNGDGFMDLPKVKQYNFQNRWAWMGEHYIFQASLKAMKEERTSGQTNHSHGSSHSMSLSMQDKLYRIEMNTERYEAFIKQAYIFNQEKNTNLALILSGTLHKQDAFYGYKTYQVDQKNGYASLMFETELNHLHSLSTGISVNYDDYGQDYNLFNKQDETLQKRVEKETVPGLYAQYTYNLDDKLVLMGGLRADHSSLYGLFVTPRAHVRFAPSEVVNFRASVGKGYRTPHVLAENNYLLASARNIRIDAGLKQEEAWNYGFSSSFYIPVLSKTLNVNAEYYYTRFKNQLVIDLDSDAHAIHFSNLQGKSYSHTFQVEASYPFFSGFTLTSAYRQMDTKTTYGGVLRERPLTSRYKGLLTASYQTPLGIWQFDLTLQLNGGGRMPEPYILADGEYSWEKRYGAYEQLSAQITRWFRHWSIYIGGENLTTFRQKNPIIGASDPWGDNFDSTLVWGPIHGAMFYVGVRYNWEKL